MILELIITGIVSAAAGAYGWPKIKTLVSADAAGAEAKALADAKVLLTDAKAELAKAVPDVKALAAKIEAWFKAL